MKKQPFWLVPLVLLAASCATPEPTVLPSTTPTPLPSPTRSETPTVTPMQPTLTATPLLIYGILTIKINVRSGPGITYDSLGQLDAGGKVQVIARDSSGAWYQILYPSSSQGRGWVTAQYVTIPTGILVPLQATPIPAGPTGRVIQRLNVRSGPGTTFNSLGLLEPGAAVSLTGKNGTASWFQIAYTTGPGGHGWVTAQYVQTDAAGDLPVLDDFGNIVTPGAAGTPSSPDLAPTPTIGPAIADGDSSVSPAINVTFSAAGTRRFIYSSLVSTPQGDSEDWLAFTPFSITSTSARLIFSLTCTGNDTLTVELWQGGNVLSGWGTLGCGDEGKTILLPAGQMILMDLAPVAGDGLQLVAYTLDVQNNP
jgi:uncharacterized protein YraI